MCSGIEKIVAGLASEQPQDQVEAIELAKAVLEQIVTAAVGALERGPNRFLVAERLHWLGSVCREPLEELLKSGHSDEARDLASLVLLQLGSKAGVETLLRAISSGSECSGLAASWLAKEAVEEASEVILERLRVCPLDKHHEIHSLMLALRDLGQILPSSLEDRFRDPTVAWEVRSLVDSSARP
jgi:hypothetical protein